MTLDASDDGNTLHVSVIVTAASGLHARPAIRLSQLAKRFQARIAMRVDGDGEWVDAKSIVRVMALKVEEGRRLDITAEGDDAAQAIAALRALASRGFDEADNNG